MRLYNTLTRRLEEFKPISDGVVKLYSCGPTVYDYPQLGNLRAFVFVDSLRRALEANGFSVKHVMNITDVGHLVSDADEGEDKLEKGAQREGKSAWEVARYYIDVFKDNAEKLNLLPPNGYNKDGEHYARATDFIDQQIEIVKLLLDKDYAYQTEQAIYFDTTKLPSYGELSRQKIDEKETGARPEVVTDKNKKHPSDFALWFFLMGRFANHEMRWRSPWGEGFPGWHLECSAIIHSTLGDPIDIHTGGVDHIGTHHPNEMAQTEAAFGHKLANYWLHNEFLLVNGQRMAKSAGNFYTLDDVEKHGYDPLALRLLYLQSHYRSQMNFTWDSMEAAAEFLKKLQAWADLKFQPKLGHKKNVGDAYPKLFNQMMDALNDDLNTARALAVLSGLADQAEKEGVESVKLQVLLKKVDELLGLRLSDRRDISEDQKKMIDEREKARAENSWQSADELRTKLAEQGIAINDTPHGPVWSRP